jgi:hypothetical protein
MMLRDNITLDLTPVPGEPAVESGESAPREMDNLVSTFERQLALLTELEAELVACRSAFSSMDIDRIYGHLAKQGMLCEKLREAKAENAIAWHAASQIVPLPAEGMDIVALIKTLPAPLANRLRQIVTKLALAEGNVRHLNHVHQVYIDGSRRTLNILSNALASVAPTYPAPSSAPARRKS